MSIWWYLKKRYNINKIIKKELGGLDKKDVIKQCLKICRSSEFTKNQVWNKHIAESIDGHMFRYIEENGNILGFIMLMPYKRKYENAIKIHITAVDSEYRRKGLYSELLKSVINEFNDKLLLIEFRESNDIQLHTILKFGFNLSDKIKYIGKSKDIKILTYMLDQRK
jgi:ribosomal protein S18 acetylase RimI-like enzyme